MRLRHGTGAPHKSRWLPLPIACAVGLSVMRCSSASPDVPGVDAGTDGAPVTADGSSETSHDSGSSDSTFVEPDAGEGWKWFAAFGPSCTKYSVPVDPKAVMPPLVWQPCVKPPYDPSDANGGCSEWDLSLWGPQGDGVFGSSEVSGDGRYLRITRLRESTSEFYDDEDDLYDRATLAPLAAWRFRNYGRPQGDIYDSGFVRLRVLGRAAPSLHIARPSFAGSIRGDVSQLMNATSYQKLVPDYVVQTNVAEDLSASDGVEAFNAAFGGGITRVNRSDHTWARAKAAQLSQPITIESDVFTLDRANPWSRLSRVETNGDVTIVREIASQHVVGLTYDGTYLYWIQLSGDVNSGKPQPHFEVWRSLYTRDIGAFNASAEKLFSRDSADRFTYTSSLVYDGVYLTSTGADTMVIRLSDKKVQTFHASSNVGVAPFYVDQKDIWVRYQIGGPGHAHYGKIAINWQ